MRTDYTASHYEINWEDVVIVPYQKRLEIQEHLEKAVEHLEKIGAEYWSMEIGKYVIGIKKKELSDGHL